MQDRQKICFAGMCYMLIFSKEGKKDEEDFFKFSFTGFFWSI